MEDNNNICKNITETVEKSKNFLMQLLNENDEELRTLELNYKNHSELLKEKENLLIESAKEIIPNMDLFSPIYNNTYDTSKIDMEISLIKDYIDKSNQDQKKLLQRKKDIEDTSNCIEFLMNSFLDKIGRDSGLSILEAQEKDRQRIACDLHDFTVQNLTSLVHKSELCSKLIDIDIVRAKLELMTMSNTLKTIINDMRNIIFNLKPMSLSDLGLNLTIEQFAKQLSANNDIEVKFKHNDEVKNVKPIIKTTIFRIIKEACQNVIKHADANLIEINICYSNNYIEVTIEDNGIGFDINDIDDDNYKSNFGLSIMKKRIALLSGTLQIQSKKGKGTRINVNVPISKEGDKHDETY